MEIRLSQNLQGSHPELKGHLVDIARTSQTLDRNIKLKYLYVEGRCAKAKFFSGTAHPFAWTWDTRWGRLQRIPHENGKVTMTIGWDTTLKDVIRLFSHELRHIGQFNRGRDRYGYLTDMPLTAAQSEDDAYEFEDRVVSHF